LLVLLATKGNLINKGCNANVVRKAMLSSTELLEIGQLNSYYTVAGKAVGFAHEQPLHVVALVCSAFRILKRLQHT
jgi:hypothetical protein